MSRDDATLINAIVAGEPEAFAELYERSCDAVYNQCFRLTGSWSKAEDLTAVVFLECWRRRRDFRLVRGSALPWLHGIAHNVARNTWRSDRRYRAALERLAEPRVMPDPADDLIERIAAEQQVRPILAALRRIPSRERQVIELCASAELTHEEVAALLDIPVGTVKSRLSRGLARLRASVPWPEALEDAT